MADFKRGIKAGVITGAIYAAVTLILAFTLADYQYLSPSGFWEATGLVSYAFVGLIIRGIVFGAIFAALYNFLPGPTAIVKGVELSFSFWVLTVIEVAYRNLTWPWQAAVVSGDFTYYGGTINLSSVSLGLISVASALVFGVLVGFFWNRFSGKEPREERKGRPVLLVSFILGVIAWAVVSGLYIRWAVVTGAPFPGVLFFSWYTMLGPPVSVAGLIGWLFALAAWRKTRRGESGFGWGLAGGILMVLTGLMLLPGALAITGAVLSRQTPEETAEKKAVAASQRQMRTGMRRNLALLIITVVMLVVVVVVGFTIPTATGTYTQVTTDRYSSTAVSRYGLSLTISLNSTTFHPGEQISVEIQEKNILPARNGLRAAHRWPVGGLTLSPCGLLEYPFGIAILQGYYDAENVADGVPLELFNPNSLYTCPAMMAVAFYDFQPWSDIADVYASYDHMSFPVDMSRPFTAVGFWTGSRPNATFSNFTPGTYTMVAGDEWGALVILHFTVS